MTARLFIWLIENPMRTYVWVIEKQGEFTAMPFTSLADIATHLQENPEEIVEVVVLLPGESVFASVITVAEQQAKYLQQSLPFVVEEYLTEDIADMYLLLGPKIERNQYVVMGINRAKLEHTLARLKEAHIVPHVMIADHTCCPAHSVMITRDKVLLRLNEYESYSIDAENINDFLAHYFTSHPATRVQWLSGAQNRLQVESAMQSTQAMLIDKNITFTKEVIDSALVVLAQQYSQAAAYYQGINFLQGKYARKLTGHTPLQGWRQVVWVVCLLAGLQLLFDVAQGSYFAFKTSQLEKESNRFYQELFPNDKVTGNVRAQMMGKLKGADSTNAKGAFLATYSRVVSIMDKHQLQNALTVTQISFNDDKGEVHLELIANTIEQLTQLKEYLVVDGLKAEIGSATTEAGKTKASLKIWP